MSKIDFLARAESLSDELVERRRDLHRHPELAFEEVRTAGIVAEELTRLGLEVQTGIAKTGVVGLLEGDQDGPTVLVRADMDALPIQERNQTDYASTVPGKMHACGHDGHTAIALGVAKLLSEHRNTLSGRVKFVFQPAEEVAGGAKAMVEAGVLDNPKPDVALGLHLWNTLPLGRLGVASGPIMAGSSDLQIDITGKGGHGALPQETRDPVVCAAQLISALQTIVSRNVSPLDSVVISVTSLDAGTAFNVIPQTVSMRGTVRTFDYAVRDRIEQRLNELVPTFCQSMGCDGAVKLIHYTDPVVNHETITERVRGVFSRFVDEQAFVIERTMGAEDVGLFMQDIPGMFFFVGSANAERGLNYGHHHPQFDFDEQALPLSVGLMAAAVADFVIPEG